MSAKYIVRFAVFRNRRSGNVYYPSGRDAGSKKHGRPISPPKLYSPPAEQVREVATFALARKLAKELRLEHGDENVAVHVERIESGASTPPRPQQLSLSELGGWPRLRWPGS